MESLLLEITPAGRIARLEITGPDGLLVLHPEADESALHGNVVRASGIEHVALPWSSSHILVAGPSPVTAAVAASGLSVLVGVGEGTTIPAVEVRDDLSVRRATWRVARVGERRWKLLAADGGPRVTVTIDEYGVPADLEAGEAWPMELAASH